MKFALIVAAGCAAVVGGATFLLGAAEVDPIQIALHPDDAQIVDIGAEIYTKNCASCHGENLEGQNDWRVQGADGRLPSPPHDESGHTWHHKSDVLFQLTKYGVAATIGDPNYASNMPAYENVLTDAEIIAVLSFIKSTWPQNVREIHDELETRL